MWSVFKTKYALVSYFFFFFNDTATTEIYTLSLHDALPILFPLRQFLSRAGVEPQLRRQRADHHGREARDRRARPLLRGNRRDRKSTRLNSSHSQISYAVFCLKKKKTKHVVNEFRDLHDRRSFH